VRLASASSGIEPVESGRFGLDVRVEKRLTRFARFYNRNYFECKWYFCKCCQGQKVSGVQGKELQYTRVKLHSKLQLEIVPVEVPDIPIIYVWIKRMGPIFSDINSLSTASVIAASSKAGAAKADSSKNTDIVRTVDKTVKKMVNLVYLGMSGFFLCHWSYRL